MPFAANFDLSTLDGTTGFRISGVAAGDQSGRSVASAGDVNGDGIDDLIIGAYRADPNGSYSGVTYVVFGKATPFAADLDLSSLDGTNGFRISGAATNNVSGFSVASAGDVNGDGIDDLLIGARGASPNGLTYAGASYVVFGGNGGFAANLELSALNGTNGFRISGAVTGDYSGWSVASAGDVNGDGLGDVIIGAWGADQNGINASGASYVVFGSDAGFAVELNLSTLDGTNGFRIRGEAWTDRSGYSVASAGDINGDGFGDLIIGAPHADLNGNNSGASHVVFGGNGGFAADLDLATLDGTNGFRISGVAANEYSGSSVASAGDVNGDGFDDLIIGAKHAQSNGINLSGASFVVFGGDAAFAANLNLSTLDGTNGFRINGVASFDRSGYSVASAGDVNGDGFADLIIGAWSADPNGLSASGASYVVYGKAGGFGAILNLSTLDGTAGFRINGVAAGDSSGISVASAGDVNGDGIDDLIIGGRNADPNGLDSGASYVIFGQVTLVNFLGTPGNDDVSGGAGADTLLGLGANDVLHGMGGDDLIDGGDLSDLLYGGLGADDLIGGGGGDLLYGEAGDDQLDGGEGADKLFGGDGADQLTGGDGNDRLDGGAGIDSLIGGAGNDVLDGGAGADSLAGGLGNDVYLIGAGDTATEAANEGYDIVRTDLDGWVLGANFEGLELQGSADIDGTGNGAANNIQGNGGNNRLDGGAGVDTINGNDGDDIIVGGLGNDLLRGGLGADSFVVAHAFGPVLETDVVYDLSTAEGDWIDLSGIDADIHIADDQTFALVGSFSKAAGQMTLTFAGGQTILRLDTTGDGKSDYQMKINGDVTGDWGGWML